MIRLLGSVCILGGGFLGIWFQRRERRLRRESFCEMTKALRLMADEIRMTRMPLPRLLKSLSCACSGETGKYFLRVAEAVADGEPPGVIWRRELENLALPTDDRTALSALNFQGDEEKICKDILLVIERLTRNEEERSRNEPQEIKRAAALWASAAMLLVILLI